MIMILSSLQLRRTQKPLPDLASFEIYPDFQPLKLSDKLEGPVLSSKIDPSDPLQLFDVFFPNLFIQYCVRCTNSNAKSIRQKEPAGRAKWSGFETPLHHDPGLLLQRTPYMST